MTHNAIFISYRRDDTADVAGRVYDRLREAFGASSVFKDVDSLPFGQDFGAYIANVLSQCSVVLALIGPHWADARDQSGLRLDNSEDWVRLELEAALTNEKVQVIPVLVNGAAMPRAQDLPESLRALCRLNAATVRRDPDFHKDMDRLANALEKGARLGRVRVTPVSRRAWVVGIGGLIAAGAGATMLWPRPQPPLIDPYLPVPDGFYLILSADQASVVESVQLPNIAPGEPPVAVEATPFVPVYEIARADVVDDFGRPAVGITLTRNGAAEMARVTAAHIGGRVALVVRGVVVFDAVIQAPLEGHLQVSVSSAERADGLVARINRQRR